MCFVLFICFQVYRVSLMITSQQKWPNASSRQMACLPLCKNALSRVEMTAPLLAGPSLLLAPQIVKQPEADGDNSQVMCAFHSMISDKWCTPELSKDNVSSRRTGNCVRSLSCCSHICHYISSVPMLSTYYPLNYYCENNERYELFYNYKVLYTAL